jgi:methionyl-tRNA formyltransferase
MNILFVGTPECAVPSLAKILQAGHPLVGVVTQPDKEKGRKRILTPSPVKQFAIANNLACFTPRSIRREPEFIQMVKDTLKPDLVIVVAFGQILPKEFLEIPPLGCINLHFSLLPEYRGASPVAQAILDGKSLTGVSTMYMSEGLDEGDILLQRDCPIGITENKASLESKLAQIGAEVLMQTISAIENKTVKRIPQDSTKATYTTKITTEMGKIDWAQPSLQIHNQVRGLNPDPMAFTFFRGQRIRIIETSPESVTSYDSQAANTYGTIVALQKGQPQGIKIQTGKGILIIQTLQPEGKKPMKALDFANGCRIQIGEKFE